MESMAGKTTAGKHLTVNVVFRKYDDGVVAECLEIPGCMAQGETEEEARANIGDAIEACLSVILEDSLKTGGQYSLDLVGIESQETFVVEPPRVLQTTCA